MTGVRLLDHWSAPDGAGAPVACLATSFTFEADFFAQDCLTRFLGLSTVNGEGDRISTIAAVLEEEDRLSEAQVSVLVDRSSPADKRNLRWDVIPISVRGGLLHAKVAVLLWERATRIILGSANLTSAGYRRQVELAVALDLAESCTIPREVFESLVEELDALVGLAPDAASAPASRARSTVARFAARVASVDLPAKSGGDLRIALAPARSGVSPLDRLDDVWRGSQPLRAIWLSPFWDGSAPAAAMEGLRRKLTGRPVSRRKVTAVVATDPFSGSVMASPMIQDVADVVVAFEPPDHELRTLHAKLLIVESDDWLAAMIGSSNATAAGFGLLTNAGHRELNLWLGCAADSKTAHQLRALARQGDRIDPAAVSWEPIEDEDEPRAPVLPSAFVGCTIAAGTSPSVTLHIDPSQLPAEWTVRTPAGRLIVTSEAWAAAGSPSVIVVELDGEALPAYLDVTWSTNTEQLRATWTANIEDRAALPPPPELRELPVDVLLAALASTRPLPAALEHELRRREAGASRSVAIELDPLKRFDSSGLLLHRVRHLSLALWRLQERLQRPATSLDGLHWRLHGAIGPLAIADGLATLAQTSEAVPGEAHFLMAELALTIAAIDWKSVGAGLEPTLVKAMIDGVLEAIDERRADLPTLDDPALRDYVRDALQAARA